MTMILARRTSRLIPLRERDAWSVWATEALRECGMSREDIRAVLAADDPEIVRRHVALHREWLGERLAEHGRTLSRVERVLRAIAEGNGRPPDPRITSGARGGARGSALLSLLLLAANLDTAIQIRAVARVTGSTALLVNEVAGTAGVLVTVVIPWILGGLHPTREELT